MSNWIRRHEPGNPVVTSIAPGDPDWEWTGLTVVDLAAGESRTVATGECEYIVLPLVGGASVTTAGEEYTLAGRKNVFAGPSDLVYVGRDQEFTVTSPEGGRIALPSAVARASFPTTYQPLSLIHI